MSLLFNEQTWRTFFKNVELLEKETLKYPECNGAQKMSDEELTRKFGATPLDLSVKKPFATSLESDFGSQPSPGSTQSSWLSEEASDDAPLDLRVARKLEISQPPWEPTVGIQEENVFTKTVADEVAGSENFSTDYGRFLHNRRPSNPQHVEQPEQRKLSSPSAKYYCRQCSKGFEDRLSFDKHIVTHSAKLFDCFICGRSYKQARDYRAHVAAHRNGSIFKCDICDCVLQRASDYLLHLKTHRQKDLMPCLHCGRYFRDSCTLSTHMRTHTGEKPYKCDICGKKFRQSGTFRRHQKVHDETEGLARRKKSAHTKIANHESDSKIN